jgi:hypothetical protein
VCAVLPDGSSEASGLLTSWPWQATVDSFSTMAAAAALAVAALAGSAAAQGFGSTCANGQYVPNGAPDVAALADRYPALMQVRSE